MAIMGHATGADMNARNDLIEDSDLLAAVDHMAEFFSVSVDQNVDQTAKPGN
jgi:hypothetical protein